MIEMDAGREESLFVPKARKAREEMLEMEEGIEVILFPVRSKKTRQDTFSKDSGISPLNPFDLSEMTKYPSLH